MAITDWPASERPREKLIKLGASALSDAELLAIFLRVGVAGKSAVDLARDLLVQFGSLNGVYAATENEIKALHGMGSSKYVQMQAAFEMCRRALSEEIQEKDILSSPNQVRDYLRLRLANQLHEVFLVMFLDAQNRLLASDEMFSGTLTETSVYPRKQSKADEVITQELKKALALIDVRVLDHFIVAGNETLSFAEVGLLP